MIQLLRKMDSVTLWFLICSIAVAVTLLAPVLKMAFGLINISELSTLDRMRYTAIQMTILDLQNTNQPINLTNDEVASKIFKLTNSTPERPTTLEIEQMYMNLTQ